MPRLVVWLFTFYIFFSGYLSNPMNKQHMCIGVVLFWCIETMRDDKLNLPCMKKVIDMIDMGDYVALCGFLLVVGSILLTIGFIMNQIEITILSSALFAAGGVDMALGVILLILCWLLSTLRDRNDK